MREEEEEDEEEEEVDVFSFFSALRCNEFFSPLFLSLSLLRTRDHDVGPSAAGPPPKRHVKRAHKILVHRRPVGQLADVFASEHGKGAAPQARVRWGDRR